jgi:parallel beta-helix repeat protein
MDVYNVSPVLTGDTISDNGGHGIYLNGSSPVITGGTISNNGQDGISGSGSPVIAGELITGNNGWGIGCSGSPSITGNTVSNNGAGGIAGSPSVLSGNTITGNNGPAIQQDVSSAWADGTNAISGNTYDGVAITGGTLSQDTTFTANMALYLIGGTVTVPEGITLTIEPGVVVKFGDRCGLTVNGTLDARGTDDQQIVFTSVWDDTYGGNTDPSGGDHTAPGDRWQICPECYGDGTCAWAANYWGQMVFGPTSVNSVVDRAVILYGGSLRS